MADLPGGWKNGGAADPPKQSRQWATETSSTVFQNSGTDVIVTHRLGRVKMCENVADS